MYKQLLLLLLVVMPLRADEPPMSFHGFLDTYYAWNSNHPGSHDNFVTGTGTSAKRANAFDLNLAAIEIVRDAKPTGFHLSIVAGNGTDVVHFGEPQNGRDVFRSIYQASVIYKASDRLTFEGGIFPSHIGVEGFFSKDPVANLVLKIEGRSDHSTAPVFHKRSDRSSQTGTLIVIGAVATF